MAAEAAWILEGRNDVETIAPYSKAISNFSDDGVSFFGAYGPKVVNQIDYCVDALYRDQFSRQAVINIWRENPPATKDVPCTLSLQFIVRHSIIHCVASMRSSDLWLGHPYDIVNFSAISFYIMLKLNKKLHADRKLLLGLGQLYLTAGSKHLYERNAADAGMVLEHFYEHGLPKETGDVFRPELYHEPDEFIAHLWECAQSDAGMKGMLQ
jgi:thymidylate synthase